MLKIKDLTVKNLNADKFITELPEFYELKKVIENNPWHDHESTFNHTLKVLVNHDKFLNKNSNLKLVRYLNKKIDNYKRKDLLTLAIFFHDFGKKETLVKQGDFTAFPEHDKISVLKAKKILNKFELSNNEKKIVLGIVEHHTSLHLMVETDNSNLEKEFNKLARTNQDYIAELVILVMTDTLNGYLKKTMPEKYKFRINFYKDKLKELV